MTPHLYLKYDEKPRREGDTLRKIGLGVRHACWNPYPISHQNLWFSLSYFRPEALEPGSWPERVTSCYGTYTVGFNIKREMALSPNDEVVASSKKTYPIQDYSAQTTPYFRPKLSQLIPYFRPKRLKSHTLWRCTYTLPMQGSAPSPFIGAKTRCRLLVSLLTQGRLKSREVLLILIVTWAKKCNKLKVGCFESTIVFQTGIGVLTE